MVDQDFSISWKSKVFKQATYAPGNCRCSGHTQHLLDFWLITFGKKEQIVGKIVSLAAFDGNRKIYVFVKKFIVI